MEKKKTFEIRTIEAAGHLYFSSRPDIFNIIWFTAGSGCLTTDGSSHFFKDSTIFMLKPGQICQWWPQDSFSCYLISFTTDFMDFDDQHFNSCLIHAFLHRRRFDKGFTVDDNLATQLAYLTGAMVKEFADTDRDGFAALRGLLSLFLIYLQRLMDLHTREEMSPTCISITNRFFRLVENNFRTRKMVLEYARELSLSPNYLNAVVKESSGLPARYHIQQRVILEAKRKAATVDMTMKEIAYDLGFEDLSHFSKFFRKGVGQNFSDFRKEMYAQVKF